MEMSRSPEFRESSGAKGSGIFFNKKDRTCKGVSEMINPKSICKFDFFLALKSMSDRIGYLFKMPLILLSTKGVNLIFLVLLYTINGMARIREVEILFRNRKYFLFLLKIQSQHLTELDIWIKMY